MKKIFLPKTKKSFTLIELVVTLSIIVILAGITFTMTPVFREKASIDAKANEVKDILLKLQNYALSPDSNNANHYILFLNTSDTPRTPYFMAQAACDDYIYGDECDDLANCFCNNLEKNEYCIGKEVHTDASIGNTLGKKPCRTRRLPQDCIIEPAEREFISRGKIDGNYEIIAEPTSDLDDTCDDIICRDFSYKCDIIYPLCITCCKCETGLFKLHFRTWDGLPGINGQYYDVNNDIWNTRPTGNAYTLPADGKAYLRVRDLNSGESKEIKIDPITGAIYIP